MSEDYQRIEVITGVARRRHWSTDAKLRIIEESFEPGETVSSVARRNGVAPIFFIAGGAGSAVPRGSTPPRGRGYDQAQGSTEINWSLIGRWHT